MEEHIKKQKELYKADLKEIGPGQEIFFDYRGFRCKIWRNDRFKHLCGYITDHGLGKHIFNPEEKGEHWLIKDNGQLIEELQNKTQKAIDRDWTAYWGFDCGGIDDYYDYDFFSISEYRYKEVTYKNVEFVKDTLKRGIDAIIIDPIYKYFSNESPTQESVCAK